MTKAELLAELSGQAYVEMLIGDPELLETLKGWDSVSGTFIDKSIRWYSQQIFEVVGNAGKGKSVHFYVINEGDVKDEKAVYKDREIEKSIAVVSELP